MTREEEKYQAAENAWNLRGLTNQEQKIPYKLGFLEGFDYADQHPRKGLWDGEKVIEWLDHYADSYTYFSPDKQETGFIGQMFDDLRKAMED